MMRSLCNKRKGISKILVPCSHLKICLAVAFLAACADTSQISADRSNEIDTIRLFDAAMVIEDNWRHLPIRGKTDYRLVVGDNDVAIRASGRVSASGLIRSTSIDTNKCRKIEWRWRVDELQESAQLSDKSREDVAASIFLIFGDPGFMSNPQPVPTLRYVWTNKQHVKAAIIDNPYLEGVVKSIVVRTGETGQWFTESRDLENDYRRAFGQAPNDSIHAIALFTDNDQTKEPVVAYYRWGRLRCALNSEKISVGGTKH